MIASLIYLLGGIAVFMLGLKYVGDSFSVLSDGKLKGLIYGATQNRFISAGLGAAVTCAAQSSVAVNMVVVSLAEAGAMSLAGACAFVVGTNVGTTVTAQLISLSFGNFNVGLVGAALVFSGVVLSCFNKDKIRFISGAALGFGLVFFGIDILTVNVERFYSFEVFRSFFLVESPLLLLLNGFFITAICQSSSVVSSMLVILSAGGFLPFDRVIYLLIGANIGTTVPVIVLSQRKGLVARRVAVFNLLFNLFGAAIFAVALIISGGRLAGVFEASSPSTGRAVANFHTFFNLASGLMALPLTGRLSDLCAGIVPEKKLQKKSKRAKKAAFG